MRNPPLLIALRQETAALHKALEATPVMARFDAADLELSDIARVLAILAVGFEAFEADLDEPWYRPQAPAIREELQKLEGSKEPSVKPISPIPPISSIPPIPPIPLIRPIAPFPLRSLGAKLGAAYVLVGSRLGARVIGRRLSARFGEEYLANSPYYGQDAVHAKPQWDALLDRLGAVDEDAWPDAIKTARIVFETLLTIASR